MISADGSSPVKRILKNCMNLEAILIVILSSTVFFFCEKANNSLN
jgi:hypothetical protein